MQIEIFHTSIARILMNEIFLVELVQQLFPIFHCFHRAKNQVPFSVAIGTVELMHGCFPAHVRMGTARLIKDKEINEDGKKRRVNMEWSTAGKKIKKYRRPNGNSGLPSTRD